MRLIYSLFCIEDVKEQDIYVGLNQGKNVYEGDRMKKEDFVKLGVDEELASKLEEKSLEELKSYVPYERFKEVNDEKNKFKTDLKDRDDQLEALKNSKGNVEALKKQISDLQAENKSKDESYAAEIKNIRINNAVDKALMTASAKNNLAARALLKDLDKAELDEEGKVKGLDEQIEALKKSDPYLFETKQVQNIRGAKPGEAYDVNKPDTSKMTYSELAAFMAENPNVKLD